LLEIGKVTTAVGLLVTTDGCGEGPSVDGDSVVGKAVIGIGALDGWPGGTVGSLLGNWVEGNEALG
jgi:hypothetical protein